MTGKVSDTQTISQNIPNTMVYMSDLKLHVGLKPQRLHLMIGTCLLYELAIVLSRFKKEF